MKSSNHHLHRGTMYHTAPWSSWETIKRVGLVPQEVPAGELRSHRGIFLWDDEAEARSWMVDEMVGMPVQHSDEWAFVLLEVGVDPTTLVIDTAWREHAYLTSSVIPLGRIKLIDTYELYQGATSDYTRMGKYESYPEYSPRWLSSQTGNPTQLGTCYEDAWRFLIKQEEGLLIHGSIQLSAEAPRVNHAWVELPTGWVWEPQTKSYYTIEDFKIMGPVEEVRYTSVETAIMAARTGNMGPWSGEERAQWL